MNGAAIAIAPLAAYSFFDDFLGLPSIALWPAAVVCAPTGTWLIHRATPVAAEPSALTRFARLLFVAGAVLSAAYAGLCGFGWLLMIMIQSTMSRTPPEYSPVANILGVTFGIVLPPAIIAWCLFISIMRLQNAAPRQ